jgi:hypothetical protein
MPPCVFFSFDSFVLSLQRDAGLQQSVDVGLHAQQWILQWRTVADALRSPSALHLHNDGRA